MSGEHHVPDVERSLQDVQARLRVLAEYLRQQNLAISDLRVAVESLGVAVERIGEHLGIEIPEDEAKVHWYGQEPEYEPGFPDWIEQEED
jgi:hypothetical protein